MPAAGMVAAVQTPLLKSSPDGVSYLAVALASALLFAVAVRIQAVAGPGVIAWTWLLGSAAFAQTAIGRAEWWCPPVEWGLLAVAWPLGRQLVAAVRRGGALRLAAAVVAAPLVLAYGLGHVEGIPAYGSTAQILVFAAVALAALFSLRIPGGSTCPN